MKRETLSVLLEFNPVDTEKENSFYKEWDEKIKIIEQEMSECYGNWQTKKVLKYWRRNDSITVDLYYYLYRNYPVPIPYVLFFSFQKPHGGREFKKTFPREYFYERKKEIEAGELANKWLKDLFSRESFYKRNKEYFTRTEVKYFLSCDWHRSVLSRESFYKQSKEYFTRTEAKYFLSCDWHRSVRSYCDLIDYFFNIKIRANGLNLSLNIFEPFRDCFVHQIVIEYFKFLCNNKKYIKEDEIREIIIFLKEEFISAGKNIDFNNHTYHSLKQLSDKWYISNILKDKFTNCYDQKIAQDYFLFICKNMKKVRYREEEIRDICDFLNARINNEQDLNFENMTWRELKRLSDEWHAELAREMAELARERDEFYRKKEEEKLNAEWKKSSIKDFGYEKDGKTWTIKEITTGKLLYEEGRDMRHCVYSYVHNCIQGYCHIFSVSCKSEKGNDKEKIATLEISEDKRLAQARGKDNSSIDNETADIIKIWADKNKIKDEIYLSYRHNIMNEYPNLQNGYLWRNVR